jgi:hypothetical protein
MNRYFYILSVCFLIISCSQKPSQAERDYIKNLEEKNKVLEKELNEVKSNSESKYVPQETKQKSKISNEYFSIGSTEDELLEVMGDPTSYYALGPSLKRFVYGSSSVTLVEGKVDSYTNSDGNLKVKVKK